MLYIFMGQSCSGKSTAADRIRELTGAEIFSGKDYLRMAKNEAEAWRLFHEKLASASSVDNTQESILYLVTEISQLEKLRDLGDATRVKFSASLDVIKERFSRRMHGRLPEPVEKMLTNQYAQWILVEADVHVDTTENPAPDEIARLLGFS